MIQFFFSTALFLFLQLAMSPMAVANTGCSGKIGNCDYYSCLERNQTCGADGYYLSFGKYYCEKYQAQQSEYSPNGQLFLRNIRRCLQEKLEEQNDLPVCSKIKKFSIQIHQQCYVENNYCQLNFSDQWRIKLTAAREILDPDFIKFAKFLTLLCQD